MSYNMTFVYCYFPFNTMDFTKQRWACYISSYAISSPATCLSKWMSTFTTTARDGTARNMVSFKTLLQRTDFFVRSENKFLMWESCSFNNAILQFDKIEIHFVSLCYSKFCWLHIFGCITWYVRALEMEWKYVSISCWFHSNVCHFHFNVELPINVLFATASSFWECIRIVVVSALVMLHNRPIS